MHGPIWGILECTSLGIFEGDYGLVKEPTLLELKDNIKGVNKIWTTVAYYESVSDSIRVDMFNKNYDVILLVIYDSSKLSLSDNTMIGVADSSKLIAQLDCKKCK